MSQENDIYQHLFINGSITPLEALNKYGCFRLGARIFDLRKEGFDIKSEVVEENGKRFAKYTLLAEVNANAG